MTVSHVATAIGVRRRAPAGVFEGRRSPVTRGVFLRLDLPGAIVGGGRTKSQRVFDCFLLVVVVIGQRGAFGERVDAGLHPADGVVLDARGVCP